MSDFEELAAQLVIFAQRFHDLAAKADTPEFNDAFSNALNELQTTVGPLPEGYSTDPSERLRADQCAAFCEGCVHTLAIVRHRIGHEVIDRAADDYDLIKDSLLGDRAGNFRKLARELARPRRCPLRRGTNDRKRIDDLLKYVVHVFAVAERATSPDLARKFADMEHILEEAVIGLSGRFTDMDAGKRDQLVTWFELKARYGMLLTQARICDDERFRESAARRRPVTAELEKKYGTIGKAQTETGIPLYNYRDGKNRLSPKHRRGLAEELGRSEDEIPQ